MALTNQMNIIWERSSGTWHCDPEKICLGDPMRKISPLLADI